MPREGSGLISRALWARILDRGSSIAPAAAAGAALALAFPDPGWAPLAWIALFPFFARVLASRPQAAAASGFAFGIVFHAVLMRWLVGFGLPAYALLTVAMSAFHALFAAAAAAALWRRPRVWAVVVLPAVWVCVEWLRGLGTVAVPWGLLGYTQWTRPPALAVAAAGGVYAVSGVIALANAALAVGGTLPAARLGLRAALILSAGLIAIAVVGAGAPVAVRDARGRSPVRDPAGVAVVQPNVSQAAQFDPGRDDLRRRALIDLSRRALRDGAGTVVWPEGAWPGAILDGNRLVPEIAGLARESSMIVAGAFAPDGTQTAYVVTPSGVVARQDKVRLVPFGEAGLTPGRGHRVLPTPLGDVGILICYESTDPALVRRLVRAGARTLIFVTNEAWFAGPAGARQHAMFAVLRAAESGRDAVRAASTGPSLHANAEGRVLAWLPWDESGYTISRIQGPRPWTPYVRFGDAWIAAAAALAALSAWPWLRQAAASADLRALWSAALWPGVAAVVGLAAQAAWPADIVRVAASGAVAIAAIRAAGSRGTGVRGGMPAASVIGAAVIGALAIAAVVEAYAAQGFPKRVASPGLWLAPLGIAVAAAIGEEVWLRGGVVGALAARPWVAVAFSVGATWGLHLNAPPELAAWRLTAAAAYAAVRIRSASVWGPALVRGAVEAALVRLLSLSSTG